MPGGGSMRGFCAVRARFAPIWAVFLSHAVDGSSGRSIRPFFPSTSSASGLDLRCSQRFAFKCCYTLQNLIFGFTACV